MNDLQEKELLNFLQKSNEYIIRLSKELKEKKELIQIQKPKIEIYNHLIANNNCENATDLFKKIKLLKNNKEVGRNIAYQFLRKIGILRDNNTPYINFAKYFKVKTTIDKNGYSHNVPLFTIEGIEFFIKKINEYGQDFDLKIEYRGVIQ